MYLTKREKDMEKADRAGYNAFNPHSPTTNPHLGKDDEKHLAGAWQAGYKRAHDERYDHFDPQYY